MDAALALRILVTFGSLSLVSIGGGSASIPQMHLDAVEHYHWLTDGQFADLFSIAQAAPGPSSLIVSLIGYGAGGLSAALLAQVAMIGPASLLVYVAARSWLRASGARWHGAVERGLAPLAVGLIVATAIILAITVGLSGRALVLAGVSTIILSATKLNPLVLVTIGGTLGYFGFV